MEIKIPKEVRQHKETIFFGLSARQFLCSAVGVGLAVGVYLGLGPVIGKETANWLCILAAAPVALAVLQVGSLHYPVRSWSRFKKPSFIRRE